jgi:hypothetical protein
VKRLTLSQQLIIERALVDILYNKGLDLAQLGISEEVSTVKGISRQLDAFKTSVGHIFYVEHLIDQNGSGQIAIRSLQVDLVAASRSWPALKRLI